MSSLPLEPGVIVAAPSRRGEYLRGVGLVLLLAAAGLFYVKWQPYWGRAFTAAETHKIGASILTGAEAAPPAPSVQAAYDYALAYFRAIWQAMVLGLLLAATIQTFLPRDLMVRGLGRACTQSSLLGSVLALPGMMCSCCAAPVAIGLRRTGASLGSAVAFFLGNPTLNPAVLVFLLFTLGPRWALLRLVMGLALVFGGAWLAERLAGPRLVDASAVAEPVPAAEGHWARRWVATLGRMVVQLVPEYVVVVGLLGFARAYLFPAAGPELGDGALVLVALALAGTLFVIPTAGEIPIIQTMMAFGMGAAPAGVLLMTLAPLSLPSLLMVEKAFPRRVVVALAGSTFAAGLLAGLLAVVLRL